nr:DUF5719 family protein [Antribacter gilvus]
MNLARLMVPLRRAGVVVGTVACVGAVAALAIVPAAGTAPPDEARRVDVGPGESVLVCPTPVRLAQPDVGDSELGSSPVATTGELLALVWGPGASSATGLAGATDQPLTGPLAAGPDGAVLRGTLPDDARVVRAEVSGADVSAVAGVSASVTTAGDLRGLAAGACAAPGIDHWLVGGSTEVGSSARLVLQNPGWTAAKVRLRAWGPSGPVALGGQAALVVPPGGQAEALLEGLAPEQRRLALHVAATGGRVTAYVQHHSIEGIVPAGTDLVTPGAAPAEAVAVAGLVSAGERADDPRAPRLRVLAPGDAPGTAHVTVYGKDGPVRLRGAEDVALEPGQVTEVPLGGLPKGTYTVTVDATVPVVAGGTFTREGAPDEDAVVDDAPYDRAWSAGQPVTGAPGASVTALPPEAAATVVLTGVPALRGTEDEPTGASAVVVRGFGADGAATGQASLELTAGTTVTLPAGELGEGTVGVRVEPSGTPDGPATVWAVLLAADDTTEKAGTLVSVLAPAPVAPEASAVVVRRVEAVG